MFESECIQSEKESFPVPYAQIVEGSFTSYDATLKFVQLQPAEDNMSMEKNEVTRVIIPLDAAKQLSKMITQQLKELEKKGKK